MKESSVSMTPDAQLILESTKGLISDGYWIKGCRAKDALGNSCSALSDEAKAFCLAGALSWSATNAGVDPLEQNRAFLEASELLLKAIISIEGVEDPYLGIVDFNDDCENKEQVIAVIESALEIGSRLVFQRMSLQD